MASPAEMPSLSIHPDADEIRRTSGWLTSHCQDQGVPREQIDRLELCLNEVLANLIEHGAADRMDTPVDLALNVGDRDGKRVATLTVVDACLPFDPLTHKPRAAPGCLAEAQPGGLGLLMVTRCSDELSYRRLADRNVLTVSVHWT